MKKKFPGYFKIPPDRQKTIWKNGLVVFDANILLNFYRYSDKTRDEFLKLIQSLRRRLWLPYQAASEYLANRARVISGEQRAYEDAEKGLKAIVDGFESPRQHPFIPDDLLTRLSVLAKEINSSLAESRAKMESLIGTDSTLETLVDIFQERIGDELPIAELEALCKTGEDRFKKRIPPGFKDANKENKEDSVTGEIRRFGDFLIWSEVLKKSKADKADVIFVTDDRKEDWWAQHNGKTLGPRPELIKEFNVITGQSLLLYKPDQFMETAKIQLNQKIEQKAIDEIRVLRRDDEERPAHLAKIRQDWARLNAEMGIVQHRLEHVDSKRRQIQQRLYESANPAPGELASPAEQRSQLMVEMDDLERQRHRLSKDLDLYRTELEGLIPFLMKSELL